MYTLIEENPSLECKCKSVSQINGKLAIIENPSGGPFDKELAQIAAPRGGGGGVLITSGSMTCRNDKTIHTIAGMCLLLFNSDMISQLKFSKDFEGYIFWMSESYMDSLAIDISRSDLFQVIGVKPCMKTLKNKDTSILINFIKLIVYNVDENEDGNREEIIKLLVKALYYKTLSNLSVAANDDVRTQREKITKDFFMLVRKHGHQHRELAYYADKMCITSKYLSSVISKTSSKRAHLWLEDATMKKAKYLLEETDNQICIIADSLNFSSPGDFVRFFRVREGMTPLQYRRTSKRTEN